MGTSMTFKNSEIHSAEGNPFHVVHTKSATANFRKGVKDNFVWVFLISLRGFQFRSSSQYPP